MRLTPQQSALLIYLSLTGTGSRTRDQVTAMFWPEQPESKARDALNLSLFRLREALTQDLVVREGEVIRLEGVECDAVEFERALEDNRREAALDLYRGDLLEGVHLSATPAFEQWLDQERGRLRARAVAAAVAEARQEEDNRNFVGAAQRLRQALGWSPYEEPLARELIRLLGELGDRPSAIRVFEGFRTRLAAELELTPSPDLLALVEVIRTGGSGTTVGRKPASRDPSEGSALDRGKGLAPPLGERTPGAERPGRQDPSTSPAAARRSRRRLAATSVLLVLAATLIISLVRRGRGALDANSSAPDVFRPNRVLVLPPQNQAGDSTVEVVSRMAADWITQQLQRTGLVEIIDPATTLRLIEDAPGVPLTDGPARLRQIAAAVQAGMVVWGSAYRRLDSIEFQLRVTDARSGTVLTVLEPVSLSAVQPRPTLEMLQQRVAGALAMVLDERLEALVPPSSPPPTYQAYQEYVRGLHAFVRPAFPEALGHFRRALALDSSFALARFWSLTALMYLGPVESYDSALSALTPLAGQLPPAERARLDALTAQARGDFEGALRATRQAVRLAPRSTFVLDASDYARRLNRPAEALAELATLDPTRGWVRDHWGYWEYRLLAHHQSGDYAGELKAARLMQRLLPMSWAWFGELSELRALAALGKRREWRHRFDAHSKAVLNHRESSAADFFRRVGLELQAHGWYDEARLVFERCLDSTGGQSSGRQTSAMCLQGLARWEESFSLLDSLFRASPNLNAYWVAALGVAAAHVGKVEMAVALLDSLSAPPMRWRVEPTILSLATLAAAVGQEDRAVELLRQDPSPGVLANNLHLGIHPLRHHPFVVSQLRPPNTGRPPGGS